MNFRKFSFVVILFTCACQRPPALPGDEFWSALRTLCGQAFEGRVVEGTEPSDDAMRSAHLTMHVRECADNQIRIPFHVGDNRSRTWVLTRSAQGVRLKHDHRHEDGSEDAITQYGGDTPQNIRGVSLDFPADDYTAKLIPAAASNIWTMSIDRGRSFTYGLRREQANRRFRVDFDLTKPVPAPPAPW
jgi:hypothetical protein